MNKFWREALWSAQTSISFSAYHARSSWTTARLSDSIWPNSPDSTGFARLESAGSKNDAMEGNWLVNSRMVHSIASRAPLQSLDLSYCFALSHVAFTSFSSLGNHLHTLSLAQTAFDDSDCPNLAFLTSLRSLDLLGCCVGDDGLAYLAPLTKLQHLYVGGPWYHDNGVPRLPSSVVTTTGWLIVGSLSKLETLVVKCIPMSAASHNALSGLDKLIVLSISLAGVDSPDLTPLMTEGSTTPLEAPTDLKFLSAMTELEYLRLDTLNQLTREGAIQLCGRSHSSLGSNGSSSSVHELGKRRKRASKRQRLHSLMLPQCIISSLVYPYLQSLLNLRRLSCLQCTLARSQIVDSFPLLEHLDCVDGCGPLHPGAGDLPFNAAEHPDLVDDDPNNLSVSNDGTNDLNEDNDLVAFDLSALELESGFDSATVYSSRSDGHVEGDEDASLLFQIATLTDLEVDFTSTSDLVSSLQASAASLKQLTLFDDEGEDDGTDLDEFPPLPQLGALAAHSASLSKSWAMSVLQVFVSAPNLVHVHLSSGKGERLPSSFDHALGSLHFLKSLELCNFRGIRALSCIPILLRLESLKLEGTEKPPTGVTTLFTDIAQSKSIRRLAITYSSDISDADLRPIVKRMHGLLELDLTSLQRVTDRTLKRLSKPGSGLHQLAIIRLKYCPLLTPQGLLHLNNLRRLYRIDTSVQSRYHYSQDQSEIDNLFSVFSRNFISAN